MMPSKVSDDARALARPSLAVAPVSGPNSPPQRSSTQQPGGRTGGRKTDRSGSPGSDTQQPSSASKAARRPVKAAKTSPPAPLPAAPCSPTTLRTLVTSLGTAYNTTLATAAAAAAAAAASQSPSRRSGAFSSSPGGMSTPPKLFACPAMFTSPKPSDLPMPSALLRRFSSDGPPSPPDSPTTHLRISPPMTSSLAIAAV